MNRFSTSAVELFFVLVVEEDGAGDEGSLGGSWSEGTDFGLEVLEVVGAKVIPVMTDLGLVVMVLVW